MSLTTSWAEISRRSGIRSENCAESRGDLSADKQRRVGEFDWELLQRAARINGAD